MQPEKIPPLPIPATALPTMRALLVGAVAQMRDLELISNHSYGAGCLI